MALLNKLNRRDQKNLPFYSYQSGIWQINPDYWQEYFHNQFRCSLGKRRKGNLNNPNNLKQLFIIIIMKTFFFVENIIVISNNNLHLSIGIIPDLSRTIILSNACETMNSFTKASNIRNYSAISFEIQNSLINAHIYLQTFSLFTISPE